VSLPNGKSSKGIKVLDCVIIQSQVPNVRGYLFSLLAKAVGAKEIRFSFFSINATN